MLLNNKDTIKKSFTFLSSDPVMDFFIKEFGNQIDPLDRHNNNYEIVMHNKIYGYTSSFNVGSKRWLVYDKNFIDIYKCAKRR